MTFPSYFFGIGSLHMNRHRQIHRKILILRDVSHLFSSTEGLVIISVRSPEINRNVCARNTSAVPFLFLILLEISFRCSDKMISCQFIY